MWCKEQGGSVVLNVRVQPNSPREGVGEIRGGSLTIRLNAPPVEGKANAALIRFLSKRLDVSKARVTIVQGEKARNKLVAVEGLRPEDVARSLNVSLSP